MFQTNNGTYSPNSQIIFNKNPIFFSWLHFLAVVLLFIGVACNIVFYTSFATSFFSGAVYTLLGAVFDLIKISLVVLFSFFIFNYMVRYAIIAGIIWVVLSIISLLAAFGFISNINYDLEKQQIKQSNIYQSANNQLETANNNINELAIYADANQVASAKQSINSLNTELSNYLNSSALNSNGVKAGTVASKIGDCSGSSYDIRAYCPKYQELQAALLDQEKIINGNNQYLAAIEHRNSIQQSLESLDAVNSEITVAPVFYGLATLISTTNVQAVAIKIKYLVLVLLAITTEFVSSLLFFLIQKGNQLLRVNTTAGAFAVNTTADSNENKGISSPTVNTTAETSDVNTTVKKKEALTTEYGTHTDGNQYPIIHCEHCGKKTLKTTWNKRFCSNDCRAKAHGFENMDAVLNAVRKKNKQSANH